MVGLPKEREGQQNVVGMEFPKHLYKVSIVLGIEHLNVSHTPTILFSSLWTVNQVMCFFSLATRKLKNEIWFITTRL